LTGRNIPLCGPRPLDAAENIAVAAHPDTDYVTIEHENEGTKEKLVLAKPLLEKSLGEDVRW
jgi:isoleucyl-tRNA synthetase